MPAALAVLFSSSLARAETLEDARVGAAAADHEAVPPADEGPPKPGFFRELGRDFVHVVAPSNLVVLGAGSAAALLVYPYDRRLTADFYSSARLDTFLKFGNVAGNGFTQGGLAAATWLAGRVSHSSELAAVGEDLARAQIINGTLTATLKLAAHRQRPDGTPWSFPSGHASAAFATATVLERHAGWKLGVPAYAAAVYIGASRLQDNKHYASDVLFGAAVGIASGRAVTFGHGRTHVTATPFAVPGGVGIAVVGVGR